VADSEVVSQLGITDLSIDPKLFQSKATWNTADGHGSYHQSEGTEPHNNNDDVNELYDESLPTATLKPSARKPISRRKISSPVKAEEKKKVSHARKVGPSLRELSWPLIVPEQQHPEHIPRPRNAFILFRKHVVDSKLIPASVEMRHQNVSIITAKMWSEVCLFTIARSS